MELIQLTEWLWCLRTEVVQAFAVRQERGVNLIDTGTAGNEEAILSCLATALDGEVEIGEIFLTHAHADHTGGAAALAERTGARVLGPAAEAAVIAGEAELPPPRLREWEVPILEEVLPHVPPAPPVTLDQSLGDGDVLGWERAPRLLAAPGHTEGQLAVWFESERVLCAGDAVASHEGLPLPGVFNADPELTTESFFRLAELDPELACFGHGEAITAQAGARMREFDPASLGP